MVFSLDCRKVTITIFGNIWFNLLLLVTVTVSTYFFSFSNQYLSVKVNVF